MVVRVRINQRRLLTVLCVCALVLFALSLGLELLPPGNRLHRTLRILEIDEKTGIATWYSSLLFAVSAGLAVAIFQRTDAPNLRGRWHWLVLALLLLLLSLTKLTSLHKLALSLAEHLSRNLGFGVPRLVFGVLLLLLLVVLYLRLLRSLHPRVRRALLVAGTVYLGGLVVLDIAGSLAWHWWGGDSAGYVVTSNLEELAEMAGTILLIRGFLLHHRHIVPDPPEDET